MLTERGKKLYENTYKTLIDRTDYSGFAITSLNHAYKGMFVRDASFQVQAHMANGDTDYACRILRYMIGYHMNVNANATLHIMPEIRKTEIFDGGKNVPAVKQKLEGNTALKNSFNMDDDMTGLFICSLPENAVSQEFFCPFDTVKSISLAVAMDSYYGKMTIEISDAVDGNVLGCETFTADGRKDAQIEYVFKKPVKVEKNKNYFFTVKCEDGMKIILCGKTDANALPAYNFDKKISDKYQKTPHTLWYIVKPDFETEPEYEKFYKIDEHKQPKDGVIFKSGEKLIVAPENKTVLCGEMFVKAKQSTGTFDVILKKGGKEVGRRQYDCADFSREVKKLDFEVGFPLFDLKTVKGDYTVETDGELEIYGDFRAFSSDIEPYSRKIQVDGNYIFTNAYTHFVLDNFDSVTDFVIDSYDYVKSLALNYFNDPSYHNKNGLLRDANYEHSREGRYWNGYCLLTNVFASEAMHKMSLVANKLGKTEDSKLFESYSESVKDAIEKNLTSEMNGKKIYTEIIDAEDGRVVKGFSFVSLSPVACDWSKVDKEILKNTYDLYASTADTDICGYKITHCYNEFDKDDNVTYVTNHVVGKGLGWELFYLSTLGETEKIKYIFDFADNCSKDVYPEVWRDDGFLSDSANQEQASCLCYMIARMLGKYEYKIK